MPTTCDIEFQNSMRNVVYTGQELCGTVRLTLTEEIQLRSVYVQIYGEGFCQWLQVRTTHTGRAEYLNKIIYLLGGEDGDVRLVPNIYTYNFQCLLPEHLPSSVETEFGHIIYGARVVLKSSQFRDKEFQEQFCVVRQLNINDYPTLQQPEVANATYTCRLSDIFCYCHLLILPPKIFAKIPKSGYVPDQIINIEIHVPNQSRESNRKFYVELIKQIHYISEEPMQLDRKEKKTIAKKTVCARVGNLIEIIDVDLKVPLTQPSDFVILHKVINVSYYIRIKGKMGLCEQIPIIELPVTIGTHPILSDELNSSAIVPSAPAEHLVLGNSNDSEPPTYEEATAY